MIAAGVQNTGPAGTIQGIASKAFLGTTRSWARRGLNDFGRYAAFHQAMLDAVNDRMDIIVLSLSEGDPAFYAPLDSRPAGLRRRLRSLCPGGGDRPWPAVWWWSLRPETTATSAESAAPDFGHDSPPGTAPSAITVGATLNSHTFYQSVKVTGTGVPASLQSIRALASDGPQVGSALNAPVRDTGGDGLACSPLPPDRWRGPSH